MSAVVTTPLAISTPTASPIDLDYELTRGFASRFIPFKARQVAGTRGFASDEHEDLAQQLRLYVLQQAKLFDPSVSDWPAFVTMLVERYLSTLVLRRRRALPRKPASLTSLSDLTTDDVGEPVELIDNVTLDDVEARTGVHVRTAEEWVDLKLDVETALAMIPEEQREAIGRLRYQSVATVARDLGIPRTTLWMWIRGVRPLMTRMGLKKFLRNLRKRTSPELPLE